MSAACRWHALLAMSSLHLSQLWVSSGPVSGLQCTSLGCKYEEGDRAGRHLAVYYAMWEESVEYYYDLFVWGRVMPLECIQWRGGSRLRLLHAHSRGCSVCFESEPSVQRCEVSTATPCWTWFGTRTHSIRKRIAISGLVTHDQHWPSLAGTLAFPVQVRSCPRVP